MPRSLCLPPGARAGRSAEAAEEACRRGDERLRAIIDSSKAVVYLKDPQGRYRLINRQWAELVGLTQESVVGRSDHDIFPAEIADAFRRNDVKILDGLQPVELEELAPHEDGIHTYLSIKVPLLGPDGTPYALCGISTDITERKRMEDALRVGEEQFRGAFEASPIGMALVDTEGRWLRVNSALCGIVGYAERELLTLTLQAVTHPEDREASRGLIQRVITSEVGSFQTEQRFLREGRDAVWVRLNASVVRDLGGRPLHLIAQIEDVTPRRQAEYRAASFHSELKEAYEATIDGWARALDLRDHETEGHSRRLTDLTLCLARALSLPEAEMVHVRRGALLHDIGKIGIPDAILRKPGKLSEKEWEVMRRHPERAVKMIAPIEFLTPALAIPRYHQEKWDGTGYPSGLAGEEIPLAAQIFAAVDVWDALTHDRPYRAAWPAARARAHLRTLAGTHLDPAVVAAFPRLTPAELRNVEKSGPRRPGGRTPCLGGRPPGRAADADAVADRLAALYDTCLLDSPVEPSFGRLVQFAAGPCAPVAVVSLIDDRRQFFKSSCGLPEPLAAARQTPLSHSFCREVVRSAAPLVIADARLEPKFRDDLAVSQLGVIAYAGMPLTTSAGHVLGLFCVIDVNARVWPADEIGIMRDLAASVMTEIEQRGDIAARRRVEEELRRSRCRVAEPLRIATGLNRELEAQRREMARVSARLGEMAQTDGLTGLKNRRHFDGALTAANASVSEKGSPLSVILIDVDEFKRYNDEFGHAGGDDVLRGFAVAIVGQLRDLDVAARYGGEEFVVLLPETDAAGAATVAERLRKAVESHPWPQRRITASFGVATADYGIDDPWALVNQADMALYHSRRMGRNRVTHYGASPAGPLMPPDPPAKPAPVPPAAAAPASNTRAKRRPGSRER